MGSFRRGLEISCLVVQQYDTVPIEKVIDRVYGHLPLTCPSFSGSQHLREHLCITSQIPNLHKYPVVDCRLYKNTFKNHKYKYCKDFTNII